MSVLLQEQIIHPTYLRLLCLDVRRRGVSLADALGGTGIPARDAECYRVGSDPWAVCTRVQDCGDGAARGTTTVPVRKALTFIMRYTQSPCGVSRRFGGSGGR